MTKMSFCSGNQLVQLNSASTAVANLFWAAVEYVRYGVNVVVTFVRDIFDSIWQWFYGPSVSNEASALGNAEGVTSLTSRENNPAETTRTETVGGTSVNDDDQCVICLSEFKETDSLRRLRCKHLFHAQCIDSWLSNKKTCPTCRCDMS